jgi:hypothetical protein
LSLGSFFGEKLAAAPFGTFATISALFGHAAISELRLLSGVMRKLDFEPAKGSFWREADAR